MSELCVLIRNVRSGIPDFQSCYETVHRDKFSPSQSTFRFLELCRYLCDRIGYIPCFCGTKNRCKKSPPLSRLIPFFPAAAGQKKQKVTSFVCSKDCSAPTFLPFRKVRIVRQMVVPQQGCQTVYFQDKNPNFG
jgi:hypothetical protein